MNTIVMPCACGMKGCTTVFEIEEDAEAKGNFRFIIKDDVHEYSSWVSLDRHTLYEVFKKLQGKERA